MVFKAVSLFKWRNGVSVWTTTRYFHDASSLQPVYSQAYETITHHVFATNRQKCLPPHKGCSFAYLIWKAIQAGPSKCDHHRIWMGSKGRVTCTCIDVGSPDPDI